ncbi:MAG TPA: patatin-like phospholipase family protein [Usitatibacter sp.]|nr:patatin-like phospholipase family protein [Usitatibacter sp.]
MRRALAALAVLLAAALPLAGRAASPASPTGGSGCPTPARASAPAQPLPPMDGLRIGLAFGSGSIHGLAHVGIIEALERHGVDVKVVTGTSVGALVGGLWASGLSGREIETFAKKTDFEHLGELSASWQGLFTNSDLRDRLEGIFGHRPIESWPRRFGAVATNVQTGGRRLLVSGDGATAIQASTAMPVYFAPVDRDGERLADGALVEPIPVTAARELGADYVIAVNVLYRPYDEPASGLFDYGFQAMHILVNSLATQDMRGADFAISIDAHRTMTDCGPDALIADGRDTLERDWPQLSRSLIAARERALAKR